MSRKMMVIMSRPYGKTCVPDFELYRKTFQLWEMGKDRTHGLSLEKRKERHLPGVNRKDISSRGTASATGKRKLWRTKDLAGV